MFNDPPAKRLRLTEAPLLSDDEDNECDELRFQPHQVTEMRDPDYKLTKKRIAAKNRFQTAMSSIIDKYDRDFGDTGDEISWATGEVIVDRGHVASLRRWDAGDGDEEDQEEEDEGIALEDFDWGQENAFFDEAQTPQESEEDYITQDHEAGILEDSQVAPYEPIFQSHSDTTYFGAPPPQPMTWDDLPSHHPVEIELATKRERYVRKSDLKPRCRQSLSTSPIKTIDHDKDDIPAGEYAEDRFLTFPEGMNATDEEDELVSTQSEVRDTSPPRYVSCNASNDGVSHITPIRSKAVGVLPGDSSTKFTPVSKLQDIRSTETVHKTKVKQQPKSLPRHSAATKLQQTSLPHHPVKKEQVVAPKVQMAKDGLPDTSPSNPRRSGRARKQVDFLGMRTWTEVMQSKSSKRLVAELRSSSPLRLAEYQLTADLKNDQFSPISQGFEEPQLPNIMPTQERISIPDDTVEPSSFFSSSNTPDVVGPDSGYHSTDEFDVSPPDLTKQMPLGSEITILQGSNDAIIPSFASTLVADADATMSLTAQEHLGPNSGLYYGEIASSSSSKLASDKTVELSFEALPTPDTELCHGDLGLQKDEATLPFPRGYNAPEQPCSELAVCLETQDNDYYVTVSGIEIGMIKPIPEISTVDAPSYNREYDQAPTNDLGPQMSPADASEDSTICPTSLSKSQETTLLAVEKVIVSQYKTNGETADSADAPVSNSEVTEVVAYSFKDWIGSTSEQKSTRYITSHKHIPRLPQAPSTTTPKKMPPLGHFKCIRQTPAKTTPSIRRSILTLVDDDDDEDDIYGESPYSQITVSRQFGSARKKWGSIAKKRRANWSNVSPHPPPKKLRRIY